MGHVVSHAKVEQLLLGLNYRHQGTRKVMEGASHPDRNDQFEFIYNQVNDFQFRNQPVISVDTKKKELIGSFANGGTEYQPKGKPAMAEEVTVRKIDCGNMNFNGSSMKHISQ
jgi:hypothetical protein